MGEQDHPREGVSAVARYAVIAIGEDQSGIVAALTGPLEQLRGNIEDSRMSQLSGYFAVLLLVALPPSVSADDLRAVLEIPARHMELEVSVRHLRGRHDQAPSLPARRYTLSVYGADHPGIVHQVTAALAAHRVNITDLVTRVVGSTQQPVYAMVMDLVLPRGLDATLLGAELSALARDLAVDLTLRPVDQDML